MSHTIPAIFNSGVFRPLEPVQLAEGTRVEVQIPLQTAIADEVDEATKSAWRDYLERMESRLDTAPHDGLNNRDHDRIIYGG